MRGMQPYTVRCVGTPFKLILLISKCFTEFMDAEFSRPGWDEYFMLQAELVKLRSNCLTRKVGAVIVRNHIQVAAGYNGTPAGTINCFEGGCDRCAKRMEGKIKSGELLDRCLCSHAESNAIIHCATLGTPVGNSTMYTTYVPCLECTKMSITAGIKRFVCLGRYPENDGGLVRQAGVKCDVLDKESVMRWARTMTKA